MLIMLAGVAALTAASPRRAQLTAPSPIKFREIEGSGFVARVWINGKGPYQFAIDTGAGINIVSEGAARDAGLGISTSTATLTGVSGTRIRARRTPEATMAAGSRDNVLPLMRSLYVTNTLPQGVDGVLDPTIALSPFGFVMDMPSGELSVFDPATAPVELSDVPAGGAVVPWLDGDGSHRPFVAIGFGRTALIDTGSQMGLAVRQADVRALGIRVASDGDTAVSDVGGGNIKARPATTPQLELGGMRLENIPTSILTGAHASAPILLGRAALRPFTIKFDPRARLIRIDPHER